MAWYEDAIRRMKRPVTTECRLLYVVHVEREGDVLRIISARVAEAAERRRYENE